MRLFGFGKPRAEVKESPFLGVATSNYNPAARNMQYYYTTGYQKNSVVYKCVNKKAKACAALTARAVRKMKDGSIEELPDHPINKLLKDPNPRFSGKKFIETLFIDYEVAGEMFIARDYTDNEPLELWRGNPTKMVVNGGTNGTVLNYVYQGDTSGQIFPVEKVSGKSPYIFHYFMPNPIDDWRGQSPLCPVADWVDVLNEGAYWNASMLHNGGNLGGIISLPKASDTAIARFMQMWRDNYQGARNAGKTAVVNQDADYKAIAPTPKDMDFERSIKTGSRAIADAYGVPYVLVSPEGATYNNVAAALEDFYTDTVLPTAQSFYEDLGKWLIPQFKDRDGVFIQVYDDSLPALEGLVTRKTARLTGLVKDAIITRNEAREELGWTKFESAEETPPEDDLLIPTSIMPIDDVQLDVDMALNSMEDTINKMLEQDGETK